MKYKLKYTRFNEYSILIEWPSIIDENILENILKFKNFIVINSVKLKLDIINTYNSILVVYDNDIEDAYSEKLRLHSLYLNLGTQRSIKSNIWEIPVCYDNEFAMDLESLSVAKSLSKSEIIQRHSQQIYTVYFLGFLPGFLYLGGLHDSLHCDRKSRPKLDVKKGAIGIGGNQTGIYPQDSPGGWHIIGSSPINFFNPMNENPCFVKAGDKIKFQQVSKEKYVEILRQVESHNYKPKCI